MASNESDGYSEHDASFVWMTTLTCNYDEGALNVTGLAGSGMESSQYCDDSICES